MAYTHYWYTKPGELDATAFAQFVADARKIIAASPIPLAGPLGEGEPEITDSAVAFNGVDDDGHETCRLARVNAVEPHLRGGEAFNFTKTAYKPYDVVVTAVLLAYQHRFANEVRLASDGGHDGWTEGRDLVQSSCGYTPIIPIH